MRRKGQSTVEYALIFVAIIAAILIIARGIFHTKVQESAQRAAESMGDAADTLFDQVDTETTR